MPALPPAAPSFAERLNAENEQPWITPINELLHINQSNVSVAALIMTEMLVSETREDVSLVPPLPLILRPPLRKKKSFSRVSKWLFPEAQHSRDYSICSVTNTPQLTKGRDASDQCVSPSEKPGRPSRDSYDTISTWETDEEARTILTTTWSPENTPTAKKEERSPQRSATFKENNHNRMVSTNVGVAI